VLPLLDHERKNVALLKLAEVAIFKGDALRALAHYRELVQVSDLSDDDSRTSNSWRAEQKRHTCTSRP